MLGDVLHAPGDVRVEQREDPRILADRRGHPAVRGLYLWIGPVTVPGIKKIDRPSPMGHEYVAIGSLGVSGGPG